MTYSMEYEPQGVSQNKKRLQDFLEQKGVSLDTVTVSFMPKFPHYDGKIDYDNPKTVSLDYLPDDVQQCTVLVDGEIRWEVAIGSTELTAK
jgi:hypothetical protein